MAGHLGDVTRTVQNLDVVRVDVERGLLLVKGAVPGHAGADIVVRPAIKAPAKKGAPLLRSARPIRSSAVTSTKR
ncbi:hypothetical protein G6F22_020156 [Rhizopus arrhizus]|nr:hypothetical protein G6F22_020156 [Rhizopus arrhizus]